MKTITSPSTQSVWTKETLLFIYKYLGPLGLALLGPVHYLLGAQIVRQPLPLALFLSALCLFGILSLRPQFDAKILIALIVLVRMGWCINAPCFSDDHFRYLHEGQATLESWTMPYTHSAERLKNDPRFPYAGDVNHPEVTASYLPGLQMILGACALLGHLGLPHFQTLRILLILFDVGILLFFLLRTTIPISERWTSLKWYAFHPLPLLEVYGNSHSDIVGAYLLLLILRPSRLMGLRNACLIALSAHIKPFVLIFSLWSHPKKSLTFSGITLVLFVLLCMPHLSQHVSLWSGLLTYVEHWNAFGLLFEVVHYCLSLFPSINTGFWARAFCGLFGFISFLYIYRQKYWNLSTRILVLMSIFWFCSPTLHPWYFIWLLPWICLEKNLFLWVGCTVWLGHYTILPDFHAGFGWHEPLWPRISIVILGLLFYVWQHQQKSLTTGRIHGANASRDVSPNN